MSQRTTKLARRAARAARLPGEVEFDARMGAAKRGRDEALAGANAAYEAGLSQLRSARASARQEANREFERQRDALYTEFHGRLTPA